MEYADWLENQQWFDPEKINRKQLDELESQAKKLLRERNYQEVTNLLEEYRDSYEAVYIIGSQIPFWDMIRTPADIVDKHIVEMMESLKKTCYLKAQKDLLASVPTARPSSILEKLAMHTFMLHYHLLKHPECNVLCPKLTEVDFSKQILNTVRDDIDALGVYYLALKKISPDENFEDQPELLNRRPLSYKEVEAIKDQAKKLIKNRNIQELTVLLKHYQHSYAVVEDISIRMAHTHLILTPEDAADKNMVELMEILKSTRYVETLTAIPETKANIVQGMLAMHTFMLNVYLQKHPESGIIRPTFTEVDSAKRILDILRKDKNISELSNFILLGAMPSYYVQFRYGLAKDCEKLNMFYEKGVEELKDMPRNYGAEIKVKLEIEAEKALENIKDVYLPYAYLEKLSGELDQLQTLIRSPHKMAYFDSDFLRKYGIQVNNSLSQQQQIEAAYRSLDERLARLGGRKPYAERFFASLKQQTTTSNNEKREIQQQRKPVKKQQSKGRKLRF